MWPFVVSILLLMVWFLALIGGYFAGGWLHLLLVAAILLALPAIRRNLPR